MNPKEIAAFALLERRRDKAVFEMLQPPKRGRFCLPPVLFKSAIVFAQTDLASYAGQIIESRELS